MSRIVSPVPVHMSIDYNEMTGAVDFKSSRDMPFDHMMAIFAQLTLQFIKDNTARLMAQSSTRSDGTPPITPAGTPLVQKDENAQ